jgi:glycosyltransferase involved in cell wall biosynthesis
MQLPEKPRLAIVSSYPFRDTNATKARLESYMAVLRHRFNLVFVGPAGSRVPEGVAIVEVGSHSKHSNFVGRALGELGFALKAWLAVRRLVPDIAIVTIPSMFLLALGRGKRCPMILDLRDLTWEYLNQRSICQRMIKATLRWMARRRIADWDLVFVTNDQEKNYVDTIPDRREGFVQSRIVRNGISATRFEKLAAIVRRESSGGHFVLLYVGNIGLAQDLTTLIDALQDHPDVEAHIVGEGTDLERVTRYAEAQGARNIRFFGGCDWNTVLKHYERCDCLYAQITANFQSAIPSKLYEYLAVGVPVIYGGQGASAEFAAGFAGVTTIDPSNVASLSDAIKEVKSGCHTFDRQVNRERVAAKYVRERQVEQVVAEIESLVKMAQTRPGSSA